MNAILKHERLATLEALLGQAPGVVEACAKAEAALSTHQLAKPNLDWPDSLLDPATVIAWQDLRETYQTWQQEEEVLLQAWAKARSNKQGLIEKLRSADVPVHRWIRCGLYAVGISVKSGPTHLYDLHVQPASDPLGIL